jgi:glycine hydroxymethyltransferase
MYLEQEDPDIFGLIRKEEDRQARGLELIPSENYVSRAVREASASVFTNKYSEGYPGRRYYGGQEFTDAMEDLAIERAKELFGASYANVQPLSGANANIALYMALLEPGDTILGMDLSHGGHLTHGHPVTYISKIFRFERYRMKNISTGEIDYDALETVAREEKPKILLAGFSAYPRSLNYAKMHAIARKVGAYAVMDAAHIAGLIAGKALTNPFDHGFDVITTTTHKTLRGPRGGMLLTREDSDVAKKIDKAVFPGLQGGPHMQQIAAKAVCFKEALAMSFHTYASQILKNAKAMEEVFIDNDVTLITGGTDNHLLLIDTMNSYGIPGSEAERALDEIGITVNKNVLPDDTRKPLDPSGIRLGTPALTTRGMQEVESKEVANLIIAALRSHNDHDALKLLRGKVETLCQAFPVPDTFRP